MESGVEEDPATVASAESRVVVKVVAKAALSGVKVGALLLLLLPDTSFNAADKADMSFKDRVEDVVEVREAMKVDKAVMPSLGLEEAAMG